MSRYQPGRRPERGPSLPVRFRRSARLFQIRSAPRIPPKKRSRYRVFKLRKKERLFGVGQALTGATGQVERDGLGSIALEAVTIGRSLNLASVFSMLPVSRVLRTQHNRVRAHPFLGLCPLRRHNVLPLDVRVAQEAVGGTGSAPTAASHRDAGRRVRRKAFHQYLCPLVEATVPQVKSGEFLLCPVIRTCCQRITKKARVNLKPSQFTSLFVSI